MKQLLQNLANGEMQLAEVAVPNPGRGQVLIRSRRSLVSLGTEKMLVDFANANLLEKALQQPDRVKQVWQKLATDGLRPTYDSVVNKLSQPIPLGYCNCGVVEKVGAGVTAFKAGDRVVSNGAHAEFVCVPERLCARVPEGVDDAEAAFTVVSAIGLQGIRLAQPTFGETVVVFGLGLIGLISAQLLKAAGCRVIGIDVDEARVAMLRQFGLDAITVSAGVDVVQSIQQQTRGIGADAVIITASTKSSDLVAQAAQMLRKKGRIVLVGVVGLEINRADFYEKELTFQVSCSYGPGRYDDTYEQKGQDYPIGYVRWTEQRNFEAILDAMAQGTLNVKPLISRSVPFAQSPSVYADLSPTNIASLFEYPADAPVQFRIPAGTATAQPAAQQIALIGAGNFTSGTLLPILRKLSAPVKAVASANGTSAASVAEKIAASYSTTDLNEIWQDQGIDTVLITTRHDSHAELVVTALAAGKNVFVEKPLCLNRGELATITEAVRDARGHLTVGYNRRFAPFAQQLRGLIGQSTASVSIVVNAGAIPAESWVQDLDIGGGRIVGEACHFIDLAAYLCGSTVAAVCSNAPGDRAQGTDVMSIQLRLHNGAMATIQYLANGHREYPKEQVQAFFDGKVVVIDNWRKLHGWGLRPKVNASSRQDKGHFEQFRQLLASDSSGYLPYGHLYNVSEASIACLESLQQDGWVYLTDTE